MAKHRLDFRRFVFASLVALGLSHPVLGQSHFQKFKLKGLSVIFNSNNKTNSRCFEWLPFDQKVDNTPLLFTREGQPYLSIELRAIVRPDTKCSLKILSPHVLSQKSNKAEDLRFEARVQPPASIAFIEGPNFRDEIIIEAPVEKLEDSSFFQFFRDASVEFESRAGKLMTNNPATTAQNVKTFPVMGGSLDVPVLLKKRLSFGFQVYQNLGNVLGVEGVRIHYAEFALGTAYTINRNVNSGRPRFSFVGEYRGRNIYQTSRERPFLIGAWAAPGVGIDGLWFPWAKRGWAEEQSHWGFELETRLFLVRKVAGRDFFSYLGNMGVAYRFSRKWTLMAGGGRLYQSADFSNQRIPRIRERFDYAYLKLSLIPYVNPKTIGGDE